MRKTVHKRLDFDRRRFPSGPRAKPARRQRQIGVLLFLTCVIAVTGAPFAYGVLSSPWPLEITLRHWAAAPNCDAARSVNLAPARRGQPGYYVSHDADEDGIACEPLPQRVFPRPSSR